MTDRVPDQPAQPDRSAWQLPEPADSSAPASSESASAGPPTRPATPAPTPAPSTAPTPAAPSPSPGYPTPSSEYARPIGPGYQPPADPAGTNPTAGYQPPSGYPPAGYPSSGYPTGGYPTGSYPSTGYQPGGYPSNYAQPSGYSPQSGGYRPPPAGGTPTSPLSPGSSNSPGGYSSYSTGPTGEPAWTPPPAAPKRRLGRVVVVAAITAAIVGGGLGAGLGALVAHNTGNGNGLSFSNATAKQTPKVDGTVSGAAARIQPSVVTINVSGAQESGTGSGVIIRSDGYILTNDHVVSVAGNGGTMSVVTNDGQQGSATLVGADESDDLAVIRVTGMKNLIAATFGKSSTLVAGQAVVAVGAPLGLSDTVTSGIVSNIARPVVSGDNDDAVFDAVQTDAAINPGNSGGPLVDLNGNVIGINAAIATANSGGVQVPGQTTQSGSIGIGFAIPADEASRIAGQLVATGKATHAVIGVTVSGTTSGTATTTGATIASVNANSAAAAAGMAAGDVVTKVGNQLIPDGTSLIAAIRSRAPGDTVAITFTRKGASKTVQVKLGTASN